MEARTHAKNGDENSLVQAKREQFVGILRVILSISAEGEEARQNEIAGYFRGLGCEVETIASEPNRFALASDFAPPADVPEAERVSVDPV